MPKSSRRYFYVFSLVFCLAFPNPIQQPAYGQVGAIGAATLGIFLNSMLAKMKQLITQAEAAGDRLTVAIGGQIAVVIESALKGYEHELDYTRDQFLGAHTRLVDDISSQLDQLEKQTYSDANKLVGQVMATANALPFSKTFPQVTFFEPYYFGPHVTPFTRIKINGNFFDSPRDGYTPMLITNGVPAFLLNKGTTFLEFAPPPPVVAFAGAANAFIKSTLVVPYTKTCWVFWDCKEEATFDLTFVLLPQNLGTLSLRTVTPISSTVKETIVRPLANQPPFMQYSDATDLPDTNDEDRRLNGVQWCASPDPGWSVDTNSVTAAVEWSQGQYGIGKDWWWVKNSSTRLNACWNLSTIHHGVGTSGKVNFRLTFSQEKAVVKDEKISTDSILYWGEAKSFTLPKGATWTATLKQFDGKSFEINAPPSPSPFLKIRTSGNSIIFEPVP